jgi:hypothetical protein
MWICIFVCCSVNDVRENVDLDPRIFGIRSEEWRPVDSLEAVDSLKIRIDGARIGATWY